MPTRAVIDSNIFISAVVFDGKPAKCVDAVLRKKVVGIISPAILTETLEVLAKKFNFSPLRLEEIQNLLESSFETVFPDVVLNISSDPDDNRVLEAAVAGKCDQIITGDSDLLDLKAYQDIIILTPAKFLSQLSLLTEK